MTPHLTVEQKRAIHRLRGRGLSLRQVARRSMHSPWCRDRPRSNSRRPGPPRSLAAGPEPLAAG